MPVWGGARCAWTCSRACGLPLVWESLGARGFGEIYLRHHGRRWRQHAAAVWAPRRWRLRVLWRHMLQACPRTHARTTVRHPAGIGPCAPAGATHRFDCALVAHAPPRGPRSRRCDATASVAQLRRCPRGGRLRARTRPYPSHHARARKVISSRHRRPRAALPTLQGHKDRAHDGGWLVTTERRVAAGRVGEA